MFNEKAMEKLNGLKEDIRGSFKPKKETKKQWINRMESRHDSYKQAKKQGRQIDKEMRARTIARDEHLRNREE